MLKTYLDLFLTFARIGGLTFGGGYAMLPMLQREVVEHRNWATEQELMDYYAVGQCTPGIIAVNTATFVGNKVAGVPGGIFATLGVIFPSFVIITIIAAFISSFAELEVVQHLFAGIRVAVCALVVNAVVKLLKSAVVDKLTLCLFLVVFGVMVVFDVSPVLMVLLTGLLGAVCGKAKKEGTPK